jgi:hypothetical protein
MYFLAPIVQNDNLTVNNLNSDFNRLVRAMMHLPL